MSVVGFHTLVSGMLFELETSGPHEGPEQYELLAQETLLTSEGRGQKDSW